MNFPLARECREKALERGVEQRFVMVGYVLLQVKTEFCVLVYARGGVIILSNDVA